MDAEIATHRGDVKPTAPKIISFEIPMDKIGEVIGPKGKVINTITQETGADVSVSDDGVVGTVSIGSKDGAAVEEARRRIELILDPPTAELGAEYTGKVVNVTKFGAFVNILPGRDGLLHISKLGRGKRIDRVEDVLNLGDEVTVRVDDIDNSGKLSLSLAGDEPAEDSGRRRRRRLRGVERRPATARAGATATGPRVSGRSAAGAATTSRWRRSTTPGTRRPAPSSATSARPRPVGPVATAAASVVVAVVAAASAAVAVAGAGNPRRLMPDEPVKARRECVDDRNDGRRRFRHAPHAARLRVARRHRTPSRPPLGGGRVLGGHRVARRTGVDRRRQPLPRAPVVQGHRRRATRRRSRKRSSRVGGDMNAFTGQEVTAFYVRVPDRLPRRSRSRSSPTSCGHPRCVPTRSSRSAR